MALFDKYKRYTVKLSKEDRYNHFSDAMEYFQGKDNDWFMFAQQARAVVQNGESLGDHYIWQVARSNIRNSSEFKKFIENLFDYTDPEEDLR
jgi:hypothetical protein